MPTKTQPLGVARYDSFRKPLKRYPIEFYKDYAFLRATNLQVAATLTLHNHVCKKKSISRVISHKFTNKVRLILRHSFLTCEYSEPRLGFRQIRAP